MTIHRLKTWPDAFQALWVGHKRHEVRENDRDFRVGDELILEEWDPTRDVYLDRRIIAEVTYITLGGTFGLPKNLCVMSVEVASKHHTVIWGPRP